MPSLLPKFVSGNKISFGKADLSARHIMPKPAFVEKVDKDNNNTDFEPASRVRFVSAGDNQTHQLVIGRNIAGTSGEQGLSGAQSSKQKQFDEWLHCRRCSGLNVM